MPKTQVWADVFVIAASIVVVGFLANHYLREQRLAPAEGVRVGDTVGVIDGVRFERVRTTVLLALHSECRFCTASMPFYDRLVAEASRRSDIQIVAIGQEPAARLHDYLAEHGLGAVEAVQISADAVPVRGTPTIVTVSRDRKIDGVWRGQLATAGEGELFSKLGLSTGPDERSDR